MTKKILLYVNTIKYLKLSQVYYRVLNKLKREFYKNNFIKIQVPKKLLVNTDRNFLVPELDYNKEFLDKFNTDDILNNKFSFINISNKVDLPKAWNNHELQHLWRYNLHYFEYLYKLAFEYSNNKQELYFDKFRFFVENWIDNNPFAYGDGWHPYTISLRITNWITLYSVFMDRTIKNKPFDKKILHSIYLQYRYLQMNLEKDVLGNHYFENIKAIIIGSIFFEESNVKDKFVKVLFEQLDEQILNDGMHFELSPMYHNIILEDIIKIAYWNKNEPILIKLVVYIQNMLDVSYSFEDNFGKVPAFNDSANKISKNYKTIQNVCKKYFDLQPRFNGNLNYSGFYIIEDSIKKLIFDTGDICPTYLPAHGHCDALSFELSINNRPIIVNSGTFRYENGNWRDYFRSTRAHNTITISDEEQSQFWGNFRIAKRIKDIKRKQFDYKYIKFYSGSYVSYNGNKHKRYIGLVDENAIIVLDYVNIEIENSIKSYLHFVPGVDLEINDNLINISFEDEYIEINTIGTSKIDIENGWYSEQFNIKEKNKVLKIIKNYKKLFFGYLINLDSRDTKIEELGNNLKIVRNKEIIINYDELRELL